MNSICFSFLQNLQKDEKKILGSMREIWLNVLKINFDPTVNQRSQSSRVSQTFIDWIVSFRNVVLFLLFLTVLKLSTCPDTRGERIVVWQLAREPAFDSRFHPRVLQASAIDRSYMQNFKFLTIRWSSFSIYRLVYRKWELGG